MASGMSPTAITTGTTSISLSMNWKKLFRRYKRKTRLSKNFILDEVGAEIRLNHYFILLLYDLCPSFSKKRGFFVPY
jgi:soluble lytic murein transglycosylase-like protein